MLFRPTGKRFDKPIIRITIFNAKLGLSIDYANQHRLERNVTACQQQRKSEQARYKFVNAERTQA